MPSSLQSLCPTDRATFVVDRANFSAEWAAALYILTAPIFVRHPGVWSRVSQDGIRFKAMLAAAGDSTATRTMLSVAWNLFNWGTKVDLTDVTGSLDGENYDRVIDAIHIRRERMIWSPAFEDVVALWK